MQLFYFSEIESINQIFYLIGQENIHLVKVLRKNIGDIINITNGKECLFKAEIISISKKKSVLVIKEKEKILNLNNLSIAIAPTKNISRIEWFVEKCVEIGIDSIIPFVSQNSERRTLKVERLQQKALSAMKQSLKFKLPRIEPLYKFKNIIQNMSNDYDDFFLAYVNTNGNNFINEIDVKAKTLLLIGPEGGFTKDEVEFAKQSGFKIVSLGENRLRTETAGVYVCSIFNSLNELQK